MFLDLARGLFLMMHSHMALLCVILNIQPNTVKRRDVTFYVSLNPHFIKACINILSLLKDPLCRTEQNTMQEAARLSFKTEVWLGSGTRHTLLFADQLDCQKNKLDEENMTPS